jgi:hypothetical protein
MKLTHRFQEMTPEKRPATKRRRSSITELAFHGIHTSRLQSLQKSEKCNPCVRYEMSPMSRAAQLRPVLPSFLDISKTGCVGKLIAAKGPARGRIRSSTNARRFRDSTGPFRIIRQDCFALARAIAATPAYCLKLGHGRRWMA